MPLGIEATNLRTWTVIKQRISIGKKAFLWEPPDLKSEYWKQSITCIEMIWGVSKWHAMCFKLQKMHSLLSLSVCVKVVKQCDLAETWPPATSIYESSPMYWGHSVNTHLLHIKQAWHMSIMIAVCVFSPLKTEAKISALNETVVSKLQLKINMRSRL